MRSGAYWFCVMMCLRVQIWNSIWEREREKDSDLWFVNCVRVCVCMWICKHTMCVYVYKGKWWCLCTGSMVWFPESVQMNCWLVQKVLTSSERVRDNQEHIHLRWGTLHPSIHPSSSLYYSSYFLFYLIYFYISLYYYYSRVWGCSPRLHLFDQKYSKTVPLI